MDHVNDHLHRVFESFVVIRVCFGFTRITNTSDKLFAETKLSEVAEVPLYRRYNLHFVFCLVCKIITHDLISCILCVIKTLSVDVSFKGLCASRVNSTINKRVREQEQIPVKRNGV